jgi:hypothetical protein
MRRLASVARAYGRGQLSPEQVRSYQSLVDKLRSLGEQLERLDLEVPPLASTTRSATT